MLVYITALENPYYTIAVSKKRRLLQNSEKLLQDSENPSSKLEEVQFYFFKITSVPKIIDSSVKKYL